MTVRTIAASRSPDRTAASSSGPPSRCGSTLISGVRSASRSSRRSTRSSVARGVPSRSTGRSSVSRPAVRRSPSNAASTARTSGRRRAPSSVIATCRVDRSKSRSPSELSSRRTCWLTAGWTRCSRSAATRKLSVSATATKQRSCWISTVRPHSSRLVITVGRNRCWDRAGARAALKAMTPTFNTSIIHRPVATVRARTLADVQGAVRQAAEHELSLTLQATGHGAVAAADGVLLDTSASAGSPSIRRPARLASRPGPGGRR